MKTAQEVATRALAIVRKVEDQTASAIAKWLREEHERCFRQQHAVDKSAAQLADCIERGEWRTRRAALKSDGGK